MAYVRHATWIAALDRAEKAERELAETRAEVEAMKIVLHESGRARADADLKLAASEQERDELRKLIETGHSRGAEISPLIRRIFSAGSRAAADRAALQAKLAAAEQRAQDLDDEVRRMIEVETKLTRIIRDDEQRERGLREALKKIAAQVGCCIDCVRVARAALTPPGAGE